MRTLLLLGSWCLIFLVQVKADPCLTNYGGCDVFNGLCWGTGNETHFCTCKAGYQPNERSSIHSCINVNECADNPCGNHADCLDTDGSYECRCRCGYVLDYTRTHCLDASQINGMCILPGRCYNPSYSNLHWFLPWVLQYTPSFSTEYSANFLPDYNHYDIDQSKISYSRAKCEGGFEKNNCGYCEDTDECRTSSHQCRGPHNNCINTEGSYYCSCDEGYVLGPCRRRCYRQGSTNIPELCRSADLSKLLTAGVTFNTYVNPVILGNYRSCATGKREGETTIENYDLDNNNSTDVTLTWVCATRNGPPRSILKSYAESEAYWGPWTAWTVCKATCWGGLQTRVRMCRNGLPGVGGCPGAGSEKRNCYNGPRCAFRVRKDVESLTEAEKTDLRKAMKQYKADMSTRGFHNAASAHGWPFQCGQSCCPHGAKMTFLSWHRTIVLNYEEGLSRYLKDKTLGLPYWNWLRDNRAPPDFLWEKLLPNQEENPFANMTVLIDRTGPMRTIQRDDSAQQGPLDFAESSWRQVSTRKIQSHIMHEFAESTESGHGGPHVAVCSSRPRECAVSLARLNFAGFDPIFMFHHSQVDRQWAIAQKELGENATWSIQTALEILEEDANYGRRQMPFGNSSLNPFPKVQAVNTMRDSYYYEELTGVKYDNLDNLGYPNPLPSASGRALRLAGDEVLFVGHYFNSDTQNFYVNYYFDDGFTPCNESTLPLRLGGALRLGTTRPFRLTIPHLTPLEQRNTGLDFDFSVKACYTANTTCRERCPEVTSPSIRSMPSPNLVYYIGNTPADVYKFDWSTGNRMPTRYINLDARSQFLLFFGDRATNVRQVRTPSEYLSCNSGNSRAVACNSDNGNACILPAGIYYLIDSDSTNCNRGLKMIVVSRMTHHY